MMGRTHIAFGLLVGLLTYSIFHQKWYFFIPLAMLGSLLPDIDHEKSKINRIIPVTKVVPLLFKHRGFFHSVFPVIIIYALFHHSNLDIIGVPLAVGYSAHLLSDCFTRMGCNLLYPLSKFRIQGFIHTNGAAELIVLGGILLADALLVLKHLF